jgi:hypothetical protein
MAKQKRKKKKAVNTNAQVTVVSKPEDMVANSVPAEILETRQRRIAFNQMMALQLAGIQGNSATLSRQALLQALSTERDYNFECGYPDVLTTKHYTDMFAREGIATRVVNVYPEECWSQYPDIVEDEDANTETEFEKAVKNLVKELRLYEYLERMDILSGIGRFGVLLLGLDDGMPLEKPLDGVNDRTGEITPGGERKLLYMRPFDEGCVRVDTKVIDTTSPRFGYPLIYDITFRDYDTVSGIVETHLKVHWSRVIHVADNKEVSEIYGVPRMKPVYNRLVDIRKLLAGSGEMFWKGGFPGYAMEINPDIQDPDIDTDSIKEEFREYSEGLQRYIAVEGVSVKSLQPQVADPEGHFTTQVKAIAMTLGVPYRIFLGSEEAKLASTEDKASWNDRKTRRRNNYVTPCLVRPTIDRLQQVGVLNEAEYEVNWPDPDAPSEDDTASVAGKVTEALGKYVSNDVETLIPPLEFFTKVLKMEQKEAEAIEEARKKHVEELDQDREDDLTRREEDVSIREEMDRKKKLKETVEGENDDEQ